jgi:hypothetical protein
MCMFPLVMSDSANPRRQLNVAIDPELYEALRARASEMERSVAGHVRLLIREDVSPSEAVPTPAAVEAA